MSMVNVLGAAASTGGVLLGPSPLMQVRLIVRRRSSDGLSIGYWVILVAAMSLWLAYGLASHNAALVVANAVAVVVAVVVIAVAVRFRPGSVHHLRPVSAEDAAERDPETRAA